MEPNLQWHPYAPNSKVTLHNHLHPINSPALTNLSTHLIFLLYHSFSKALPFKHFWALSCAPRGATPPFSDPAHRATYPTIFSRLSTPIYAPTKRWSLTSNVTPTSVCSSIYRGDQPVSKDKFSKFFGPFPRDPGAQRLHFRTPLLALRIAGFFPASLAPFTPDAKRWSLTSNVTTCQLSHRISLYALRTLAFFPSL